MWWMAAMVTAGVAFADADGDGFSVPADCDDSDPAVHPGARERGCWDGLDDNCDGRDAHCPADFVMGPPSTLHADVLSEAHFVRARPGANVVLVAGAYDPAGVPVPGCAGLHVPVSRAFTLGRTVADGAGNGTVTWTLPLASAGRMVTVVAVDRAACAMGDLFLYTPPL